MKKCCKRCSQIYESWLILLLSNINKDSRFKAKAKESTLKTKD